LSAIAVACGYVRVDGLPGPTDAAPGPAPATDGGVPAATADAAPSGAASGLYLRAARFTDGFDDTGWQCNGTLCLKGGIRP
jgi:hypothetical protein